MESILSNRKLRVRISDRGAELQSILLADGTECLWQGDARYWGQRAPNLFPYVARLTQGQYTLEGKTFSLPIHGFAPGLPFAVVEKQSDSVVFRLESTADTLAMYPFRFCFDIRYQLSESTLNIAYRVQNNGAKPMYFGLGGHPGFRVPLEAGPAFEEYYLEFSRPCEPIRIGFSPDCFVTGSDTPFPLENKRRLRLAHSLFDQDAIVLAETAGEVTLAAARGAHRICVSYPQMPYLGLWHAPKTDAPYLCIEPWTSLPSRQGIVEDLAAQDNLIALDGGGCYINRWSIRAT